MAEAPLLSSKWQSGSGGLTLLWKLDLSLKAENVFFVPLKARWTALQAQARHPKIGRLLDQAMDSIERQSPSLNGVLPKVYAKENLDVASVGGLISIESSPSSWHSIC